MPAASHAESGSPVTFVKSMTAIVCSLAFASGGRCRVSRLHGRRIDPGDQCDETVPSTRDRLDELRGPGIVTKCLAQLGDRLGQRVVRDVGVGPQRIEQLLFRDQCPRVVEQMQQEVEELWRQLDDGVVSHDAIAGAIDEEWAELVAWIRHALRILRR